MSFGVGAISELAFAESTTGDGSSITIVPTGVAATFGVGSVVLESIYFPTGVSATFSPGSVVLESRYFPDGVGATFALGTATIIADANVTPTGVSSTFSGSSGRRNWSSGIIYTSLISCLHTIHYRIRSRQSQVFFAHFSRISKKERWFRSAMTPSTFIPDILMNLSVNFLYSSLSIIAGRDPFLA